jgi:GT2 family glycosyltransferase
MHVTGKHADEDHLPLVSVIILYYKRRETIAETVESVLRQDYPNREILLIDNHSQDGLRELVEERGYDVQVIETPGNLGACGGRNFGIRASRGQILVFLDDDVSLLSPQELSKTVETFASRPRIGVLAYHVCDPDTGELRMREWCHPRYWKDFADTEFETHWFCEGGSSFRREVFERCGGYYEPLFYGAEGHDLAVRVLDHGYRMLYCPRIRVGHRAAKEGRTSERQYYFYTRNFALMAYKDYHFFDGLRFFVPKLLMMLFFAVRTGACGPFLRGLRDGIAGWRKVGPNVTRAGKATLKYWEELEQWRPGLWKRLARHRKTPLL